VPLIIVLALLTVIIQRTYYLPHTIIYGVQLLLVTIGFKYIYHIDWLISVYLAFMSRFYIYGIAGIALCSISYITEIPILVLKHDRPMYGIVFIIARATASLAFVIVKHLLMIPNRGRELTYPRNKLFQIILMQVFASLLVLSVMAAYSLELNPRAYIIVFLAIIVINFFASKLFYEDALHLTEMRDVFDYSEDLKRQIVRQTSHYKSFEEEITRFKKLDHDYQSMLMVLESLIGNSPTKATDDFINGFVDEIKQVQSLNSRFCNNVVLDALFTEMFKICKRKEISFDAKVYMDDKITISNFDIVRVANNLLRNAIEASMKIEPSKRFIRISSKVNQGWTVFTVENAYNGHLKKTGQRIFTTKQETNLHGNGLNIVRELVEKRGGIMTVDAGQVEKIFTVKMTLKHK